MCPLESSANGRWSLPCLPLYGQRCRFTCYYSVGQPATNEPLVSLTLTCDAATGNWSPAAKCPPVASIDQRSKRQTVTTVGKVTPRPPVVQKPVPRPVTKTTTTTPAPETTTMSPFCPNLNPPVSGLISGQCVQAVEGDTCTHSCISNFTLIGPSIVNCTGNATWSSGQPKCVASDCPALGPSDAKYIGPTCSTSGGLNGITLCMLECANSPLPVICWNNKWIPPTPPKCADAVKDAKTDQPKSTTATEASTSPGRSSPPQSSSDSATSSSGSPKNEPNVPKESTAKPTKSSDNVPGSPSQIPVCIQAQPQG